MSKVVEVVRKLRRCELGMETTQTVVMTGVCAVALAALYESKGVILAWAQSCLAVLLKIS
ncbi:MAG: hypothetical protein K8U03_24975 [Planctomycetia bacterium]|nr:hypothetical protein [Planctomycetia bacterium]